jgi:hypothetical protein
VMRERPLEAAFREEASNHLKLSCLRGTVVSVEEKAGETRQVSSKGDEQK